MSFTNVEYFSFLLFSAALHKLDCFNSERNDFYLFVCWASLFQTLKIKLSTETTSCWTKPEVFSLNNLFSVERFRKKLNLWSLTLILKFIRIRLKTQSFVFKPERFSDFISRISRRLQPRRSDLPSESFSHDAVLLSQNYKPTSRWTTTMASLIWTAENPLSSWKSFQNVQSPNNQLGVCVCVCVVCVIVVCLCVCVHRCLKRSPIKRWGCFGKSVELVSFSLGSPENPELLSAVLWVCF